MTVAPADLAGRAGKILARFPTFMLAPTADKVLASIAVALGKDLDESERLATLIQRSHRLPVADEAPDVLRLAALLGLHPADFFILSGFRARGLFARRAEDEAAEPLTDAEREQRGHQAYVDALRAAVQRTIAVLMEGCGTLWALLEGTAVVLDAQRLDAEGHVDPGARVIEHVDADRPRGGFVHRMPVRHHVIEDGEPAARSGAVYLVENPLVERASEDRERRQRERFRVTRGGFFPGPVSIRVTGVADRTVHPMVINGATHEGVGFAGAVGDGQTLVFTVDGKALLDGADVTAQAYFFRGALADDSPLDGEPPRDVAVVVEPAGAMVRGFPRPALSPPAALPVTELPLGDSDWRFSVEDGAFDASTFGGAVFRLPDDPEQLALLPPSGRVQLEWEENEPFAATVLIPSELQSLEEAGLVDGDLRTLVRAGLERFRTAGVRLDVAYFEAEWILGKSVLESLDAPPGPGVDFDATVLPDLRPGDPQ